MKTERYMKHARRLDYEAPGVWQNWTDWNVAAYADTFEPAFTKPFAGRRELRDVAESDYRPIEGRSVVRLAVSRAGYRAAASAS